MPPSLPSLLDFQLFLVVSQPIENPLYSSNLCPPYECQRTGDPLHPPHPTQPHTSNTRICVHTSAEIQRYDMRITTVVGTMATNGSASAASKIEEGSIYLTMHELRAAAAKRQIHVLLLRGRVVGCGGLTVRRHSYRGRRVELWGIADWQKTAKNN